MAAQMQFRGRHPKHSALVSITSRLVHFGTGRTIRPQPSGTRRRIDGLMRALLFADRPGQALLPLTERACVAMLPVVGKPLVVFAIEDLALAQIHEAFVVVGAHADLVKQE